MRKKDRHISSCLKKIATTAAIKFSNQPSQLSRHKFWTPTLALKKLTLSSRGKSVGIFPGIADSICMAAVLEDCIDELAILKCILHKGHTYSHNKSARLTIDGRVDMEKVFGSESQPPLQSTSDVTLSRRERIHRQIQLSTAESDMGKIHAESVFLQGVVDSLYDELLKDSSYLTLIDVIRMEKMHKKQMSEIVKNVKSSNERIKQLQDEIRKSKRETVAEVEKRIDKITQLKELHQQIKIKCLLEKNYTVRTCRTQVEQSVKRNEYVKRYLLNDMEDVRKKDDIELRVHSEMMAFLTQETERLTHKREFWAAKYVDDNAKKAQELQILKTSRARDLERMSEITKTYAEYEQVCVRERLVSERQRKEAEMNMIRLKAGTKIQAWWRGTMVRKGFGPWRKTKKNKGKRKGKKNDEKKDKKGKK